MNGSQTTSIVLNNPRTVRAWCMYDWANSVYSLVITSSIFPIYYKAVAVENGSDMISIFGFQIQNSILYTYSLSFSFLIVAIILPLLSGMADYTGKKKLFMKIFVFMGGLACMGLFFFKDISDLPWGIFCSVVASIGYSGSLVFYDAFLPEIVSEDRYDATSARGYSMGYYGSVVLLIICLVMIMNATSFGFPNDEGQATGLATRFAFLLTGMWWIGFAMIPFSILQDNENNRKTEGKLLTKGYQELRKVWASLKDSTQLKRYLFAFFFFNMGVQTVMYLAQFFGTDILKMGESKLIATVLIIQLVGALGAYSFARLSRIYGNKKALTLLITIWIIICLYAYFITSELQFYTLAFFVGLVMGGIQALSRATYAKLIPPSTIDHASYFSFYDVTYNLSIVFGTFSYGFINQITGSMRNSVLALAVFFIIGFIFLTAVKSKKIDQAEA
jgi:MFS transporter, UMF1 family